MEFNRMLSELDAGLVIGVGAMVIFAGLIYMMTAGKDAGDDEAIALYKSYHFLIKKKAHNAALIEARKYFVAIMAKTKSTNDLGEAFVMIASVAELVGNNQLALVCAVIANHYLSEKAVQNYPLYRACRDNSVLIEARTCDSLSELEIKGVRCQADEFMSNKLMNINAFFPVG